ncbi:hypothetical protein DL546_008498 [Coniochaeta pulveracea]|uniref:Glucose-methanol-choline oxidoreductase C-terminal domain-containing protein n=1 Tax=Coniochaeta pulveracea TaxID=177199 RepID=A0A420YEY9_9PEZI|nr:hypothetical protein DL546_008498 [Coniochaeta pulveracea]
MMNNQSSGQVSLQSSDPADPPKIDLNFLDHPYDVRTTIEALRKCAELLLESRVIPTDPRLALGPQSLSDEAILVRCLFQIRAFPGLNVVGTDKILGLHSRQSHPSLARGWNCEDGQRSDRRDMCDARL